MPTASPVNQSVDQVVYSVDPTSVGSTLYGQISGSKAASATLAVHEMIADRYTVLSNLRVYVTNLPGGSVTGIVTLVKNGSDTDLVIAIDSGDSTGWNSNTANIASAVPGDKLALKFSKGGGVGATYLAFTTVQLSRMIF